MKFVSLHADQPLERKFTISIPALYAKRVAPHIRLATFSIDVCGLR